MSARSVIRRRRALVPVAAALALVACAGSEPAPHVRAFVGPVEGSAFFVGVALDGEDAVAFLTDGARTGVWYTGRLQGDAMYLEGPGEDRLSAKIEDDRATGTATAGGRSYRVDAPLAAGGGVFRAEGPEGEVTGWVVLSDGRQKGVRTAGRRASPAPTLSVFATSPTA